VAVASVQAKHDMLKIDFISVMEVVQSRFKMSSGGFIVALLF
jgi:hypothetical protein